MDLLDRRQTIAGVRPARAPYADCDTTRECAEGRLVHEVVADKYWHGAGTNGGQFARYGYTLVS
jgi:hypothetical protein